MTVFCFIIAFLSRAAPSQPSCAERAGAACDFFRAHAADRFIEADGGTFVANPAYAPDPETTGALPRVDETPTPGLSDPETLGRLMDILDVSPIKSARTKLKLSVVAPALFEEASKKVLMPWPLTSPRPEPKMVDQREALSELTRTLGRQRVERLRELVGDTKAKLAIEAQRREIGEVNDAERLRRARYVEFYHDAAAVEERRQRVRQLFVRAKADTIRIHTGDGPRRDWTPEQLNLVERIDAVQPRFLTVEESETNQNCKNMQVNATFDGGDHEMIICPAAVTLPDLNLVEVFGHELGHSIDACALSGDFAEFDRDALKKAAGNKRFTAVTRDLLAQFYAQNTRFVSSIFEMYVDSPQVREELVKLGVIRIRKGRFEKMPEILRHVNDCLEPRYNVRTLTPGRREQMIADHAQALEDFGGLRASELNDSSARLRRFLEKHPDCPLPGSANRTQRNEVMADVNAALVRESYLRDHPAAPGDHRIYSTMGAIACQDQPSAFGEEDLSPGNTAVFLANRRNRTDQQHPGSWKRVLIESDLPGLARFFDCARDETGCFDHLSLVKPAANGFGASGASR